MRFDYFYENEDLWQKQDDILYHATWTKTVPKIEKNGIVPQKKPSSTGPFGQDIRQHKDAIYAFNTKRDAIAWAFEIEWSTKEPASIVTFKRGDRDWQKDSHWQSVTGSGDWLYCQCEVPPEDIISVEPMTPELAKAIAGKF